MVKSNPDRFCTDGASRRDFLTLLGAGAALAATPLDALTEYRLQISSVTDLAGNVLVTFTETFTPE